MNPEKHQENTYVVYLVKNGKRKLKERIDTVGETDLFSYLARFSGKYDIVLTQENNEDIIDLWEDELNEDFYTS